VTADGGLSAQFEHSLLITESGVEILTVWDNMESSGALYSGGFNDNLCSHFQIWWGDLQKIYLQKI